jgi:menaquinone-dependent protoporphyrinogen oxidase
MARILVAYATRNGSTQQVAEAVAAVVRTGGADVRVTHVRSAPESLDGWDLVILGAPIYSGRWHPDARRFLKRHRRQLSSVPVAVFALGPRDDEEEAWQRSWTQLWRALDKRVWLVPVAVELFGGADPSGRHGRPRRDLRDWDAIGQWAGKVLTQCDVRGAGLSGNPV